MTVAYRGLDPQGGYQGSAGKDGQATHRFRHIFETTTAPNLVGTYADLFTAFAIEDIRFGALCPLDPSCVCDSINPGTAARRIPVPGAPFWEWTVEVGYSRNTGKTDPNNSGQKDPLLRPPEVTFDVEVFTEAATVDLGSFPSTGLGAVTTSAGEPINRDFRNSHIVCRIRKNFASWPWPNLCEAPDGYLHTRNAATWFPQGNYILLFGSDGVPAGKALMEKLSAAYVYENNTAHVAVSAEIRIDLEKGHQDKLKDQGWMQMKPGSGKRTRILDDGTGRTPVAPVLLDGSGMPLTGSPPLTPLFRNYQYYVTKSWAGLNLP